MNDFSVLVLDNNLTAIVRAVPFLYEEFFNATATRDLQTASW